MDKRGTRYAEGITPWQSCASCQVRGSAASHMPIAQHALGKLFGATPCGETPEGRPSLTFIVSGNKTMTIIVTGRFLPAFAGRQASYLQLYKERLPLLTAHSRASGG